MRPPVLHALVALLASLCAVGLAHAGELGVSPIYLEMKAERPVEMLEITNSGDQVQNVQLRLFAWTSAGADESYAPSGDVQFNPPMFTLQPGQKQIVRLAARQAPQREMAYRLFVDQLTPARSAGGLSMPIRIALPLFVEPRGAAPTMLAWRIEQRAGRPALVAANLGGRRSRLTNLQLVGNDGATTIAPGLSGYVLAGQERVWPLKSPAKAGPLRVRAESDQGALEAEVVRN
jgi:fimbrial chaperone protein